MKRYFYLILLIFNVLYGCRFFSGTLPGDVVIASVGDKVLLRKELTGVFQSEINKTDSLNQAKAYIQRWIKHQLILKTAEEHLSAEQKDVQQELDEYRSSLLIHRYEQELMLQQLDTTVTDADIKNYYEKNPGQFLLDQNIVKAYYLEMPKNQARPDFLKRLMFTEDDRSINMLQNSTILMISGLIWVISAL